MNLLILTHYLLNHQELGAMTSANKKRYADRHGYNFFEQIGNYCEWGFDFQRIQLIYDKLFKSESPPDIIWWLGCDTMIMNQTKKVTDFLLPEDKSLYINKDVNGINNDSFLIRRTEWTKKWLEFVMSKQPEYKNDCWESQRVFQHFVETDEWKDGLKILDHPAINSYFYDRYSRSEETPGHFNYGDLLLHLPGMTLQERLDTFRSERVLKLFIE